MSSHHYDTRNPALVAINAFTACYGRSQPFQEHQASEEEVAWFAELVEEYRQIRGDERNTRVDTITFLEKQHDRLSEESYSVTKRYEEGVGLTPQRAFAADFEVVARQHALFQILNERLPVPAPPLREPPGWVSEMTTCNPLWAAFWSARTATSTDNSCHLPKEAVYLAKEELDSALEVATSSVFVSAQLGQLPGYVLLLDEFDSAKSSYEKVRGLLGDHREIVYDVVLSAAEWWGAFSVGLQYHVLNLAIIDASNSLDLQFHEKPGSAADTHDEGGNAPLRIRKRKYYDICLAVLEWHRGRRVENPEQVSSWAEIARQARKQLAMVDTPASDADTGKYVQRVLGDFGESPSSKDACGLLMKYEERIRALQVRAAA